VNGVTADVGAELRKGVVESCVVGLLEREPMSGWPLSETLVKHNLIASIGTLYPMLTRLRYEGLVITYDEASGAGLVRKNYRLTAAGTTQLRSSEGSGRPSNKAFITSSERTKTMAEPKTSEASRAYLAELGEALAVVPAEARAQSAASPGEGQRNTRGPVSFDVIAALLVMVGGVVNPFLGWLAGLTLVWISRT
jgi:PadR family transcriptional regulator PadR